MSKARDLASGAPAPAGVTTTELGYVDGVSSAIQTQIDGKEPTLPSQTGNSGKYLTTNGTAKSWGTVSQYALPSQTGNSGKFLTTNGTSESWGTVNTPITWTQRLSALNNVGWSKIAYNGSNLYVIVGGSGTLYTSSDGITWTSRTSNFGANTINDVAYGNGLWVAVGAAGTIITSTDGITWTARTSNMGGNVIYAVTYANSLWVAVGAGGGTTNTGGIIYSTDGLTWTRKSQSLTVGATYQSVVWNGTNWIVGANYSTNNFLYASTPSGTWTVGSTGLTSGLVPIIWDGTRHILTTGGNTLYSNTSTTLNNGSSYAIDNQKGTGAIGKMVLYNSKIYLYDSYINVFSPTSNSNYVDGKQNLGISPSTVALDTTFSAYTGCFYVGSIGYIVASSLGEIWTSF